MKSFKQFLLEDPQRGKTIIFYHRTGFGGQSRSHKHMKQENINDHVDSFLKDGFHIGEGDMYGRGVYGFYTEKSMLGREGGGYGNIVLKTKVNTDKILITVKEVAKKVYGRDITLEDQFKILKLKYPAEKMIEWEREYRNGTNDQYNLALNIVRYYGKNKITKLIKGLVYKGNQDFEAMVVYDPKLLTVMGYNTTVNDSTKLDGMWINVLGKNKKQIKTALTARLSTVSSYERLFNETQFLENIKKYGVKNYNKMSEREKNKLESRLIEYVKLEERGMNKIIEAGIKPSEAVQIAAVKEDWENTIRDIIEAGYKLSEAVQIAAVEKKWWAIEYIIKAGYKLSEKVISAAINSGWYDPPKKIYDKLSSELKKKLEQNQIAAMEEDIDEAIKYIMKAGIEPSEKVISTAIEKGWYYPPKEIYDKLSSELKKKIEQNQIAAVEEDWEKTFQSIIKAGIELSEAAQIVAVEKYWWAIREFIKAGYKLSEAVQIAAIKTYTWAIQEFIKAGYKLSEAVQIAAIKNFLWTIQDIIKAGYELSEAVQLAVMEVGNDWRAIQYIKNVYDSVIKYVIDNYDESEISDMLTGDFKSHETKQKLQAAFDKKYK